MGGDESHGEGGALPAGQGFWAEGGAAGCAGLRAGVFAGADCGELLVVAVVEGAGLGDVVQGAGG